MAEGFSFVMLSEVISLEFRGVCSSSESHSEFPCTSPGSENVLWYLLGYCSENSHKYFSELIVVDSNMCVSVDTIYHNSTKVVTASQACVISKYKNLKQNIKMRCQSIFQWIVFKFWNSKFCLVVVDDGFLYVGVGMICHNWMNPTEISPLNTNHRPLYLKPQSVPRCKHFSSWL